MKSIDRIAYSLAPLRLRLWNGDAIEPRLPPVPPAPEGRAPQAPERGTGR
jgi:hypothetical protein